MKIVRLKAIIKAIDILLTFLQLGYGRLNDGIDIKLIILGTGGMGARLTLGATGRCKVASAARFLNKKYKNNKMY